MVPLKLDHLKSLRSLEALLSILTLLKGPVA